MNKEMRIEAMAQWIYSRMPAKLASYDAAVAWAEELYNIAVNYVPAKGSDNG